MGALCVLQQSPLSRHHPDAQTSHDTNDEQLDGVPHDAIRRTHERESVGTRGDEDPGSHVDQPVRPVAALMCVQPSTPDGEEERGMQHQQRQCRSEHHPGQQIGNIHGNPLKKIGKCESHTFIVLYYIILMLFFQYATIVLMKVIFAQGNPGEKYALTRHNVGVLLLDAYAKAASAEWKDVPKFNARIAELTIHGEKTLLVFPQTYYNETGLSARKLIDFYKVNPATDLLVIHDDLALPLGTLRTRGRGSDAGNNGIKSLNAHIGEQYHRIRVGISVDRNAGMSDVDFVLGRFSSEELDTITTMLAPHVHRMIDSFAQGELELTSHSV